MLASIANSSMTLRIGWLIRLLRKPPLHPPRHRAAQEVTEQQAPAKKIDLLGPEPPQYLAAFREWWLSAPGLDHVGPRGRVPPRGAEGAALMILVTDPEEGDGERLLFSGPRAPAATDAQGYGAERRPGLCRVCRAAPLANGRWTLASRRRISRSPAPPHPLSLAPQRIISFGANILPLLAHNAAQDPKSLREN